MNNSTTLLPPNNHQTETMVVDGIRIRLNFSNEQAPNTFENIRQTLLRSHQIGKKIARIQ